MLEQLFTFYYVWQFKTSEITKWKTKGKCLQISFLISFKKACLTCQQREKDSAQTHDSVVVSNI